MTEQERKTETVSIVMPVYNPGKYLAPCLDSLLAQTFRDFRLIAIDDGSTDGSGNVLRAYAEKDNRILAWRNPENLGAARTRNIGIQMAKGKYLSILDADDFFEPEYLMTLVDAMERYGVDIAECDYYLRDERTGKETESRLPHFLSEYFQRPFAPQEVAHYLLQCFKSPPFVRMFRRDFLIQHSLLFQDISNSNDVYFDKMALALARSIYHVPRLMMHYRCNTGMQITTTRSCHPENPIRAMLALKRGLELHQLFPVFASSWRSYAIRMVRSVQTVLSESARQREIHRLGLEQLTEEDVDGPSSYFNWKHLQSGESVLTERPRKIYDAFFQRAMTECHHVALWGYGKLGREFLQEAERYGFPVQEIYDRDAAKWQRDAKPPILPFAERSSDIDAVIVTNLKFYPEIREEVRAQDGELGVYDFDAYAAFGVWIK